MRTTLLVSLAATLVACSSPSDNNAPTNNGNNTSNDPNNTSNNANNGSNNGSNNANNQPTNNDTTATNNGTTTATNNSTGNNTNNQTIVDPELLAIEDVQFVGAFRVPAGDFGPSSMNFSQGPIAVSEDGASVFLIGHTYEQAVAQFTIPALVDSSDVEALEIADDPTQGFVEVMSGLANPQDINTISGMAVVNGELVVNAQEYYDAPADNSHTTFVVRDVANLGASAVDGFYSLDGAAHASGWVSPVPSAWQDALGGPWIAGNSSGTPIISRLSVGPSAFAFDPADLAGAPGDVATVRLLDYDLGEPLNGDLDNAGGDNDVWTHLSQAVYGVVWPGTRTYATFGHTGGHDTGVCYKCTPVGGNAECGGYCSNDVDDYAIYYWFYDVDDLVAVRAGQMAPHEVRPYAYGEFAIPFDTNNLGGGTFDPASGTLYLTAQAADREQGQFANPPVIMAFRLAQ